MSESGRNTSELVADLFLELSGQPPEERRAVYSARDVPSEVIDEVESLLGVSTLPMFDDGNISSIDWPKLADAVDAATGSPLDKSLDEPLEEAPGRATWSAGTRTGDYEIVREIARGGMGVVFEARQISLGRRVAVKVVRGSQLADSTDQQRFRTEVEAIARLEHPGIVPVYEVGELDGLPFYSMAYMPGGSLAGIGAPLDLRRAVELMIAICEAIHHAHTRNIVHRDLKPANVLLSDSLAPRVSDFGLAKDVGQDSDLTHTGAILGTPGFMAPEQASGGRAAVSHLADVYGLGGLLFYLLTGRPPIDGDTLAQTLHKVLHDEVPDVRRLRADVPADLASVLAKAVEKDPMRRYGSALALADDLRRFRDGQPPLARPLTTRQRLLRTCRRHKVTSALIATVVLAIAGGGAVATRFAIQASERATELALANEALVRNNRQLESARAAATAAGGDAEAFAQFLVQDVIRAVRPVDGQTGMTRSVLLRDALIAAMPRLETRFAGRPHAELLARQELAISLRHVGAADLAIEQLEHVIGLRERLDGPHDIQVLQARNSLGTAHYREGQFRRAVEVFEPLAPLVAKHAPQIYAQVLLNLAQNYDKTGRFEEAFATLQLALEVVHSRLRPIALARMGIAQARLGNEQTALELAEQATAAADAEPELGPSMRLGVDIELVVILKHLNRHGEMADLLVDVIERSRHINGPDALVTLELSDELRSTLERSGRIEEALEIAHIAIQAAGSRSKPSDRTRLQRCAELHLRANQPAEALAMAEECHRRWMAADPEAIRVFQVEAVMIRALIESDQPTRAREILDRRLPELDTIRQRAIDAGQTPRPGIKIARRKLTNLRRQLDGNR